MVIPTYGQVVVAFARLVALVCNIKEIVHCILISASLSTLRLPTLGKISIHRSVSRIHGVESYLVSKNDGKDRLGVQERYYRGLLGRHTFNAKHITRPETGVITAANPT